MPTPVAVAPVPNAPTQTTVSAPKAAPVAVKPTPAAEATFEVTVDGKPAKLTRRQIEQYAGKGAFADRIVGQTKAKLAELQKLEAEMRERDGVWDDEEKLAAELEKRGKLDLLARKRLAQKVAEAEMTPDQRAIAERDAKISALEADKKKADDERSQRALSENAKRIQSHMENELSAAADRVGIPRDADGFLAVYEATKEFRDLGLLNPKEFTAADAERICETAKENIEAGFKRLEGAVLKGLKGKALFDRLGKSVVDELNRYQVELIRGGGAKPSGAPPPTFAPAAKPSDYMTQDQAREAIEKLRRGGK